MSSETSLNVSVRQVKAARMLLAWSQDDLAREAGIGLGTLKRLEADDGDLGGRPATAAAIVSALESAGIIFVADNEEGPGVRLRKRSAPG